MLLRHLTSWACITHHIKAKILLQVLWLEKGMTPCQTLTCKVEKGASIAPRTSHSSMFFTHYFSPICMGFSDSSEKAHSGVMYIRMEDLNGAVHTSLIISKNHVVPIKRLTIPRLELNGALILALLISHCKDVPNLLLSSVYGLTLPFVLAWIHGTHIIEGPHR